MKQSNDTYSILDFIVLGIGLICLAVVLGIMLAVM
jgi:hypothetical protein